MSGGIHLLPPYALMSWRGTPLPLPYEIALKREGSEGGAFVTSVA